MSNYVKLFGSIVASTIWEEDNETRIIWITMLAMANWHGEVEASIPGLAKFAKVSIPATEASLAKLLAPDAYSRSKEHEGRRIEEIDGGWIILNHRKYRDRSTKSDKLEQDRIRAQRYRDRKAEEEDRHANRHAASRSSRYTDTDSPTDLIKREPRAVAPLPVVFPDGLQTDAFKEAWANWLEHLKQKRKPPTAHAKVLQLKKLAAMGPSKAIETLNNCIEKNWQGIYDNSTPSNSKNNQHRIDRAIGTTNEGRASEYAGLGRLVKSPDTQRPGA